MEIAGILYVLLVTLSIVLLIAWIVMPLAIIGTKPLLRELIQETKTTNSLLRQRLERSK